MSIWVKVDVNNDLGAGDQSVQIGAEHVVNCLNSHASRAQSVEYGLAPGVKRAVKKHVNVFFGPMRDSRQSIEIEQFCIAYRSSKNH